MNPRRIERLRDLMQRELADILLREIQDPRIRLSSVSRIELNSDITLARIYVSTLQTDPTARQEMVQGFRSAAGRIRFLLGRRLDLRQMPELRFLLDDSMAEGDRILSLIEEIETEPAQDATDPSGERESPHRWAPRDARPSARPEEESGDDA